MDATKLVNVYIKMRDAKDVLKREYESRAAEIDEQMETIEQALLEICKATGQDGGKTAYGTFSRSVKTRYWTNDWDSMYGFIKKHDAIQLLEQRIHQSHMKQFLTENPGELPQGLNADSKYSIIIRRATK